MQTTTTTAYFNAETGTTNWEEMWRQEDGEETQPKFDCRRMGESIIILASFFFCLAERTHVVSVITIVRSFLHAVPSKVSLVALDVNYSLSSSVVSLFIPNAEPALVTFLAANTGFVPELLETKKTQGGARVLVPGCGRGYALETLSSTFDSENVVGLEVSETARRACEAYQTERASKAKCIVDDFFTHAIPSDDDRKYDVVYDCTFLCAIQPKQRTQWAEQMKMLTKKGSRLISVVFPLGDFEGGPPFALSPELVTSLLQNDFDVEESIEVPEDDWARGKPEYLCVFRRR